MDILPTVNYNYRICVSNALPFIYTWNFTVLNCEIMLQHSVCVEKCCVIDVRDMVIRSC